MQQAIRALVVAVVVLVASLQLLGSEKGNTLEVKITTPPVVDGSSRARAIIGSVAWFSAEVREGGRRLSPNEARCVWSFGDGQKAEGMNVYHTFTAGAVESPQLTTTVTATTKSHATAKAALVIDVVTREALLWSGSPMHSW